MNQPATPAAIVATMEELHGYYIEELEVGMTAVYVRTVTETDIVLYSQISGDDNPLHVNEEFARQTVFKGRIAHGMLTCGYISAVLGTKLPGPGCAYLNQNLNFRAPVRIGDTVQTRITVKEIDLEFEPRHLRGGLLDRREGRHRRHGHPVGAEAGQEEGLISLSFHAGPIS